VKTPIYFLLLTATFLISCKKYSEEKNIGNNIIGTWELEHYYGWPESKAYPPGNGNTISFSRGFVFETRTHDTLTSRGTYSLVRKNDCDADRELSLKTVSISSEASYHHVDIEDGKLSLGTPSCYMDGGTSVWKKL